MCRLASFLHNPKKSEICVQNIVDHGATAQALKITESMGWYEGHYLPNGEIQCRIPDGLDPVMAAEVLRRWPSFTDFFKWCFAEGKADTNANDGRSTIRGFLKMWIDAGNAPLSVIECDALAIKMGMPASVPSGYTPIFEAVMRGDFDGVTHELAKANNTNVNERTLDFRRTPLIKLMTMTSLSDDDAFRIAELLINAGADVNAVDKRNSTALYEAVRTGWRDVSELLLTKGADPRIRNSGSLLCPQDIAQHCTGSAALAALCAQKAKELNEKEKGNNHMHDGFVSP